MFPVQAPSQWIGTVMERAIAKGFRLDNPAGDAISAALPKNGEPKRYRALPHGEVGSAPAKMRVSPVAIGPRLDIEFLVLTAAGSTEVRGARWSEIDLDAVAWEILGVGNRLGREPTSLCYPCIGVGRVPP